MFKLPTYLLQLTIRSWLLLPRYFCYFYSSAAYLCSASNCRRCFNIVAGLSHSRESLLFITRRFDSWKNFTSTRTHWIQGLIGLLLYCFYLLSIVAKLIIVLEVLRYRIIVCSYITLPLNLRTNQTVSQTVLIWFNFFFICRYLCLF